MKGKVYVLLLAALVAVSVLAAACRMDRGDLDAAEPETASYEVTIRASDDGALGSVAPRTVLPEASGVVSTYAFSGVGPSDATFELESADPWLRTHLVPGRWTLSVRGENAAGLVLLVGSVSVLIEPGAAGDFSVPLSPRAGSGTVRASFSLPPELPAGTRIGVRLESLRDGSAKECAVDAPFADLTLTEVASGYHVLSVRLIDTSGAAAGAGLSETVRVLPDTESALLVDFATLPGTAAVSALPFDGEPIAVRLPVWTYRSSDAPLPLEAFTVPAPFGVSWRMDGLGVAGDQIPAPLPLGSRRVDAIAAAVGGTRGGSSGGRFEVLSGVSSGAYRWAGTFIPDAAFVAGLPATHGFIGVAASADGRRIFALDAPAAAGVSGIEARSAVHVFIVTERGVPLQSGVFPVVSGGSPKSCERLAVSPDGVYIAAWDKDASWIAFRSVDAPPSVPFVNIPATVFGATSNSKPKDVEFSADSRFMFVLSSASPYRITCFSLESGSPVLLWTKPFDDPAVSSAFFSDLAVHPSGTILALASTSNVAVVMTPVDGGAAAPEIKAIYKKSTAGFSWLDGPGPGAPLYGPANDFLFLCSASGSIGRIGIDSAAVPYCSAVAENRSEVSGATALQVSADGSTYAILAPGSLLFGNMIDPFPTAALPLSAPVPGLGTTSAVVWSGTQRLFVSDAAVRSMSIMEKDL